MTALALSLAFAVAVFGALAWRWMSLNYSTDDSIDPVRVQEALSDLDTKVSEHESKLSALMLERGLRTSKESRA